MRSARCDRPALRRDTPVIVQGNTDTRVFRVATKLLSELFLNGTAQGKPLSRKAD
jgi:hypothetical protein